MSCVIRGCKSHSSRKENQVETVSFLRFPTDVNRRQLWINKIAQKNFKWKKHHRICSKHFSSQCFKKIDCNWRRLKIVAVPSLYLHNERPTICYNEVPSTSDPTTSTPSTSAPITSFLTISATSSNDSSARERDLMNHIAELQQDLAKLRKISKSRLLKINCLRQKTNRLKTKNTDLNLRLMDLLKTEKNQKENLLLLDCVKNNPVVEKYLSKKQGVNIRKYSLELKKIAVTLNYLSPRAYAYVRDELKNILPHPKTLSKWYQCINCDPGFTTEAFDAITARVKLNRENPIYCALSVDEMALRKLVEWDGKKYFGYVNIGCDLDSYDIPLAREALTFMLTTINDTWKIPVGYFLIQSITAKQKSLLVQQCLTLLKDTGVNVVSLTFDGATTNKAMCSYLGCDINFFDNIFTHNGDPLCLWPDPCHNIKLIRNTFGDRKHFIDNQGNEVSWHYIELLHQVQESEGLHLGTKLKKDHVQYVKQKMKVRLATQLLSTSVADALEFLKDLGLPEFVDCGGTIQFIRLFNDLFDIMNSRNIRAKGYKRAISKINIDDTKLFFDAAEIYINNLKFADGSFVINSNRSTGFRGFIICMKSLITLYTKCIESSGMQYLCLYKLSQDHIELFFGAIRAKCGFNNNPSARMFRAAYKRLLVHAQFKDGSKGNCIPLESLTVLNYYMQKYKDIINSSTWNSRLIEFSEVTNTTFDHDYILHTPNLTEYAHHVVHYIAGYIVRKLQKKIHCEVCVQTLEEKTRQTSLSLISIKDRGGLVHPSYGVNKVCKTAEKILREFEIRIGMKSLGQPKYFLSMINKISELLLPTSIFHDLVEHSFDNHLLDDHRNVLIKLISKEFLTTRIHYSTKKLSNHAEKIRSFFTKTVIFKGQ